MNDVENEPQDPFVKELDEVFDLHERGNYEPAEALYRKLIAAYPGIWQICFNFGLLLFELGRFDEAAAVYRHGIDLDGQNPDLWYNLALCRKQLGDINGAIDAYQQVLSAQPTAIDSLYNLAGCYRTIADDDVAICWYERAVQADPGHLPSLNNLAYLHHKHGRTDTAAKLYRTILSLAPDHERADHMLASIEEKSRQHVPDGYVRDVFDQFSDHYESDLVEKLEYSLPAQMLQFMQRISDRPSFGRLLDLGCGTGLAGEVLKPHCDNLIGVDLSANMIAVARPKSLYSELHIGGIIGFLQQCEPAAYDCAVAADVLPYVGDLKKLFEHLAAVIDERGYVFISVERLADEELPFKLQPSGRFAHSSAYVRSVAAAAGWYVRAYESLRLRREKDDWISGMIYALARAVHPLQPEAVSDPAT